VGKKKGREYGKKERGGAYNQREEKSQGADVFFAAELNARGGILQVVAQKKKKSLEGEEAGRRSVKEHPHYRCVRLRLLGSFHVIKRGDRKGGGHEVL